MVCKTIFISFLFPILNFVLDFFMITMSSIISQYFNSFRNPNHAMPLCFISNFIMFPRSCNCFNGKKYLQFKLGFNPQVYNQFGKTNQVHKSPRP